MTASSAHSPALPTSGLDAEAWVQRWERQQANHVAEREATFTLMLDVIDRLGATPGCVVDLGCGPGSLAARALARWPLARVVGVDLDPVLMDLGRQTLGDRVRWIEADLRHPRWSRQLEGVAFNAAMSATALHWLAPEHLGQLARSLAGRLRPGGVFVNYDTMLVEPTTPRLRALCQDLRSAMTEEAIAVGSNEGWSGWWAELAAKPEMTAKLAERTQRFGARRRGPGATLGQWVIALRDAGFQEVGIVKQVADRRVLVAIR